MKALDWILRLVPAAILAQTLFFKLSGAPESVWIFSTLGVEPWGRCGTALAELVAVVLLLVPRLERTQGRGVTPRWTSPSGARRR